MSSILLLGILATFFGAVGFRFRFSSLGGRDQFQTYTQEYDVPVSNLYIEHYVGRVKITTSDEVSNLTFTYQAPAEDQVIFHLDGEDLDVIGGKESVQKQWWNIFQYVTIPYNMTITIPETWTLNQFQLELCDGIAVVENNTATFQIYGVYAGALQTSNISGKKLEVSANGGLVECKEETLFAESKWICNGGTIQVNHLESSLTDISVSAGYLSLSYPFIQDAFTIDMRVSAGFCSVSNQESEGTRKIQGKVTGGYLQIHFAS